MSNILTQDEKVLSKHRDLIEKLQKNLWTSKNERRIFEEAGIKIAPCDFYSNLPSINEIENSYEYESDTPPYSMCDIFGSPEKNRVFLEVLSAYAVEFTPPQEGNSELPEGYFWNNSQFSYADAMSYYTVLRHLRPKKVIEIGSGFSTLIAIEALNKNGEGVIECIEPFPRKFLEQLNNINLVKTAAQSISADYLNSQLSDGDVLFIDSTHTVKTGSDCLHIYLRLLPKIKHTIYIHVHDIFLPFGFPKAWLLDHQIYWTEQYLLLAFLLDNAKAQFLYGSSYHEWANKALLEKFMHGQAEAGGSSFWFKYEGNG